MDNEPTYDLAWFFTLPREKRIEMIEAWMREERERRAQVEAPPTP